MEIRLRNDEPVAALQFTLQASAALLDGIQIHGRAAENAWTLLFHTLDDSTMNVILMRTGAASLASGSGSIASLSVKSVSSPARLSFSRIVVASPTAESIASRGEDLIWDLPQLAASFQLGQNYPNPFNPSTTIPYRLDRPDHVRLSIFDVTGREINRVIDHYQPAGSYSITWSGGDAFERQVPSGVYFVRFQVGANEVVGKMILAR
ncbi:MAG: T9SS type A sorting domain-containing protein [Ignavibacteriales bacterium]|nr:T9SS type A sorting domain-containing protein [Ignavibacteriales bacterium]